MSFSPDLGRPMGDGPGTWRTSSSSVRAAGWRWAVWRCRAIPEAVAPAPVSVLLWGLRGSWSVTLAMASARREGQGLGAEDRQGLLPGLEAEVETPVAQRSHLYNLGGGRERRSQSKGGSGWLFPGARRGEARAPLPPSLPLTRLAAKGSRAHLSRSGPRLTLLRNGSNRPHA